MQNKTEPNTQRLNEFIASHFSAITQIEVLCFIRKNKEQCFSAADISHRLFLNENQVSKILIKFIEMEFVVMTGNYYQFNKMNIFETDRTFGLIQEIFDSNKTILLEILFKSFMEDI